jgi:glycosyltransferase involved in cell wall biosynthesis
MKALAEKHNLLSKITWHGWQEESFVRERMRHSDALVMTSLHEGLPMVAVEALWQGLALVGTRIGGLLDVIKDGRNGFLCDPDPTAIAKVLRLLIKDRDLLGSMQKESLTLARRFDFSACVTAYEQTLTRASGRG